MGRADSGKSTRRRTVLSATAKASEPRWSRLFSVGQQLLVLEGPTRPVALMRIGLALILWMTWGDSFVLFRQTSFELLAVAAVFYAATALMLVGWFANISTFIAGTGGIYIYFKLGVLDGETSFVHHHTLLMVVATMILSLAPVGASLSVDRWRAMSSRASKRSKAPRRMLRSRFTANADRADLWALRLLSMLVAFVYLGGALSKTNLGWLSGDRLEQIYVYYYGSSHFAESSVRSLFFQLMTVSVVALEWTLALGLFVPRLRRLLIPLGVALHFSFYVLLPVETFSLTMLLLYISFMPNEVDRWLTRLLEPAEKQKRETKPAQRKGR